MNVTRDARVGQGQPGGAKSAAAPSRPIVPPQVRAALFALRFYKTYLSSLFAGSCRYEPTCSQYAAEAIERFGVVKGMWLGLKRLLRCHPLSRQFGYDPVPEKWEETPSNSAARKAAPSEAQP